MNCPVCVAECADKPVTTHQAYTLHHCLDCDVQFWRPMKNPGAGWYETYYDKPWDEWPRPRPLRWSQREFLRSVPVSGGALLDVGCGSGTFLAEAQRADYRVTGFDFSDRAVDFARSHWSLDDVHACSFESFLQQHHAQRYDVISFFDVLEHQDDIHSFMSSVVGLMPPGGFLALSVPNRERALLTDEDWDKPPHHFTRWNTSSLTNLCARYQLSIVQLEVEPLGTSDVALWLKETLGIFPFFRALLSSLARRGRAPGDRDPGLALGRPAMKLAVWSDTLLLPVTWPLKVLLEFLGKQGSSLFLLAQFTGDGAAVPSERWNTLEEGARTTPA